MLTADGINNIELPNRFFDGFFFIDFHIATPVNPTFHSMFPATRSAAPSDVSLLMLIVLKSLQLSFFTLPIHFNYIRTGRRKNGNRISIFKIFIIIRRDEKKVQC